MIRKPIEGAVTLYLKNAGDTINRFLWGRWNGTNVGSWAAKVDFNGDDVGDYLLDDGIVYRGIAKNTPPDPTPVAKYQIPFWRLDRRCIADFNGDGKEDLLDRTVEDPTIDKAPNDVIGQIILGNSDLTKMKVLEMPVVKGVAEDIQNIVSAWRENGKNYLVLYEYTPDTFDPRSDGFVLYEFTITADSAVHYTELDYIPFKSWPSNVVPYYSYSSSFVWHSRDMKEHTLVVSLDAGPTDIYTIQNGKLLFVHQIKTTLGSSWPALARGISSLSKNAYARGRRPNVLVYDGDPAQDTLAKARFPMYYKDEPFNQVSSCGDVNNDGHGDIAVVYNSNTLVIYAGMDSLVSSVHSFSEIGFDIRLLSTQPTRNSLTIEVSVARPCRYTIDLFNLRGEHVASLMDENLMEGVIERSYDVSSYGLPPGLYNLRLSDGTRMVDKGILITR